MTAPLPNAFVAPAAVDAPEVRWPEEYQPAKAQVLVSNEIIIPAPAEVVWAWLVRAEGWPGWYENARDIHFLSHTGPDLRDRSRFRWKTFGMRVTCKVREFKPCERLAWDAHGLGVEAWHAWVLTPMYNDSGDGATHVLTQETQTGWLARLSKRLAPTRMYDKHQMWLEGLSRQAQSGMPGSVGKAALVDAE